MLLEGMTEGEGEGGKKPRGIAFGRQPTWELLADLPEEKDIIREGATQHSSEFARVFSREDGDDWQSLIHLPSV